MDIPRYRFELVFHIFIFNGTISKRGECWLQQYMDII
jgi:hypothetical protein